MALSAFTDKTAPPVENSLAEVLGPARHAWHALRSCLETLPGLP